LPYNWYHKIQSANWTVLCWHSFVSFPTVTYVGISLNLVVKTTSKHCIFGRQQCNYLHLYIYNGKNCLLPLVQQKDTMCMLKCTGVRKSGVGLRQWHQIHKSIATIIVLSNLVSRLPLHGSERREGKSLVHFHMSMGRLWLNNETSQLDSLICWQRSMKLTALPVSLHACITR